MARALNAGPVPRRRRTLFGLLDADGWGWAAAKAAFWFIVIIFMLGYIPDRAYYFTVNRTIDLGILAWSPVNFCPGSNESVPCPAPQGAVLPWHPAPPELALPAARTDGAVIQAGQKVLYIGGSDGTTASSDVFVAQTVQTGNFDKWTKGPPLPAARTDAGVAFLGGSIYVVGGNDETGKPTATAYVLTPDLQTGDLGTWKTATADTKIDLPEPRAGGSLVALADGLLFVGGNGPKGLTDTTWKAKLDSKGKLGTWTPQAKLASPVADATAVLNGDHVWVFGGRNASGPVATVQRGTVETKAGDQLGQLVQWGINPQSNLPEPRTNASGFVANGALYIVGGSDGSRTRGELFWAIPSGGGDIREWKHLGQTDLPSAGLEGGAAGIVGPNVVIVGGKSGNAIQTTSARSDLAPQEPFFQLGLVGATVPALKIEGEIGQQLGYLNAAGAGTVDFIILILVGLAFAHRERTKAIFDRLRRRRR
jgi:hypothetical protein